MAENWKIEKGLCRCCHSEGSFHPLSELCTVGEEEGYYRDMLRLTLEITIEPVEEPQFSSIYTICDDCILRLRDATAFKQQVIHCEARFRKMYAKGVIQVSVEPLPVIKKEPDTEDQKMDMDLGDMNDDNDDSTCNIESEPAMEAEIEFFKEESDEDIDVRRSGRTKKAVVKLQAPGSPKPKPKLKKPRKAPKKIQRNPEPRPSSDAKDSKDGGKDSDDEEELKKFTYVEYDNGNAIWKCDKCSTEVKSLLSIQKHIKAVHLKTNILYRKCYVCEEKFGTRSKRNRHLLNCHGMDEVIIDGRYVARPAQKVTCEVCKKEVHKVRLQDHTRRHKLFKCRYCKEKILDKDRIRHRAEAHNIIMPMLSCGVCDFKCESNSRLIYHQRYVHMKEKTVPCPQCDCICFSKAHLTRHMVMHNPVKKFACSFCTKKFPRRCALTAHEKIHTGDKRKVCEICGEKFVQKASLNYHMLKRHPEAC